MGLWTLRLAGTALVAAAMLTSATASAQARRGAPHTEYADPNARYGYPRPSYEDRDAPGRAPVRRAEQRERCDQGNAGTILGAIAGGLLGNAPAGRRAGAGRPAGRPDDRGC
jgi:uncharacterized protein YcfJ